MTYSFKYDNSYKNISASNVDDLVKQAISNILKNGERIKALRSGGALQDYLVNYILENPRNRLHTTRPGTVQYFTRELQVYCNGTLNALEGLAKASKFWTNLADHNGQINSNYGYYVFYEKIETFGNQYNWVIHNILSNRDTRRAIININQSYHKTETKDFPCTVGVLFYIRNDQLFCEVCSRSTDVVTGLPYDIGFFSFLHELVFQDLVEKGVKNLQLGSTIMKTSFTQIYDKTLNKALEALNGEALNHLSMPTISNAAQVLEDIYQQSFKSDIMQWIEKNTIN
jgi:thymidylate synthase